MVSRDVGFGNKDDVILDGNISSELEPSIPKLCSSLPSRCSASSWIIA